MFDNTDNLSVLTQAAYKGYVDCKLRYTAVLNKVDKISLKRPPTGAKTKIKKEEKQRAVEISIQNDRTIRSPRLH